ncbi:MAG: DEAD/DEAH box helicase family protein [Bacteroidetes bacterium]|nr:DEAD/DEAH box helicase family protein [Bacteroidota bacterium]
MDAFSHTSLLDERTLAMRLRPYQRDAVEKLHEKFIAGKRQFHVVAPPGSGKTIIGIAFLQRLRCRTVILSPNAAIQAQWIDKYGRATADLVDTFGEVWGGDVRHLVSHDPGSGTPILSLTYQRIAVREGEDGSMHENVRKLIALFREQRFELLILDECHHLLAFWAEVLKEVLAAHPMLVLGLTATPPVDRAAREQATYLDLVGPVDYQIPLPAVVKDGNLAPFQDLVCLVHPEERELAFIRNRHEQFHTLLAELNRPHPSLAPLDIYVQSVLDQLRYRGKDFPSWSMLLEAHTAAAIAMGRYALSHGIPLPATIPALDEMEDALTLDDVVLLLQGYLEDECNGGEDSAARERVDSMTHALRQLGYELRGGVFVRRQSDIDRVLALSAAKLGVLRRILTQEIRNLGDAVRALVLTDFETAQAGGRKALAGVLDPEAGGAVAVMRTITSDPATDVLDPVMLTGSTLLCDDDLAARFLEEMRAIAAREEWDIHLEARFIGDGEFTPDQLAAQADGTHADGTHGMFEIMGAGRDWDTRTYVLMITALFDRGLTRCLIGTRGLLGEGWDSAAANVLIDLTAVASYVSVNQMHGRSLRLDPAQPEKVANNWDVVAVLPEYERGFADWQRFVRKHEHFFGLSDDGELERGIGHVHPLLTHLRPDELAAAVPLINEDMLARSARRDAVFRAWRIGLAYRGVELPCLEYRPDPASPTRVVCTARSTAKLERLHEEFQLTARRLSRLTALVPAAAAAAAGFFANAVAPALLLPAMGGSAGITTALMLLLRRARLGRFVTGEEEWTVEEQVMAFATAVRDTIVALRESGDTAAPEIMRSDRDDGCLRVWIESASDDENRQFSSAMNELFRPVQDQRYILRTWRVMPGRRLRDLLKEKDERAGYVEAGIVPVPSDFAGKRERADVFHRFWQQHVGRADLLYTRRGEGVEVLRSHLRERFVTGRRFVKILWK